MLSQEYLKTRLDYDPDTGIFIWKQRIGIDKWINGWNSAHAGKSAGTVYRQKASKTSYHKIFLDNKSYEAHQLAWLYMMGEIPKQIDHIDENGLNNAFINLRLATNSQNMMNRSIQRNNTCGFKGVCALSNGKYKSQITANKKTYLLGTFITKEEAAEAYRLASIKYHGEYGRF